MTTTLSSLQSGGGKVVWVAAIEGFEYLLTNGIERTTWPVAWASLTNCTANGPTLTKSAGGAAWDAGAVSTRAIYAGKVSITVATATDRYMVGLSNGNTDVNYTDIDFAAYVFDANLYCYESGVSRSGPHTVAAGDVVEVSTDGAEVAYAINGTIVYTSAVTPTLPLLVDCSIYGVGDSFAATLSQSGQSAVLNAWGATPWTKALSGLHVEGDFEQQIKPFSTALDTNEIRLRVTPDPDDILGIACHKSAAGNETYLEDAIDCNDASFDGSDGSDFSADDDIYIGIERIEVGSIASDTFTVATDAGTTQRGKYAPFSYNGGTNLWGRPHNLPSYDYDVRQKPIITDAPRTWIGKWVGLWLHVVEDGVVNDKSDAQLVFAGHIADIADTGETLLTLTDVKRKLATTTLLHDQFRGRVAGGIYMALGMRIEAYDYLAGTGASTTTLDVVAGAPADETEIQEGWYTAEALLAAINHWLTDATMRGSWWTSRDSQGKVSFHAKYRLAGTVSYQCYVRATKPILEYLGYEDTETVGDESKLQDSEYGTTPELVMSASRKPYRVWLNQGTASVSEILLEATQGTFIDNREWLPSPWFDEDATKEWGLFDLGGQGVAIAAYDSATETLGPVYISDTVQRQFGGDAAYIDSLPTLLEGDEGYIEVTQIVALQGTLKDLVARLFASTGTGAYNHATYDDFDAQLGAGIPWELLGSAFELSLDNLAASTTAGSILIMLEKPMRMWDVIKNDLLLRGAFLRWKSGSLHFVSPTAPNAVNATHTWTASDKASAEPADLLRVISQSTEQWLRNVYKIRYNRKAIGGEQYLSSVPLRNTRSIDDHGQSKVQTIDARNSYGQWSTTVDVAEELALDFLGRVAPLYSRPLRRMRYPISLKYFEDVAPGDVALITDPHVRDPDTGARGITAKPALILRHSHAFGGDGADMVGEVDVLFQALDREAPYSPTADVASYAAQVITCDAHGHSESSEAADASHFQENDAIACIERDPTDPAAPDIFTTTVDSVSGNDISIDDAWAAYNAAKKYYVVSDDYATAASTQKTDAYLADDGDGKIVDVAPPNLYADDVSIIAWSAAVTTELAERPPNIWGTEGEPHSTGYAQALARNANNLISRATAAHMPHLFDAADARNTDEDWVMIRCYPEYLGAGAMGGWYKRQVSIAPMMASSDGSTTVYCRVTLSVDRPLGSSLTAPTFATPYKQLEAFSTSSATMAVQTAKTTVPVYDLFTGRFYVTIEVKSGAAHAGDVQVWGLPHFWLGPVEEV